MSDILDYFRIAGIIIFVLFISFLLIVMIGSLFNSCFMENSLLCMKHKAQVSCREEGYLEYDFVSENEFLCSNKIESNRLMKLT